MSLELQAYRMRQLISDYELKCSMMNQVIEMPVTQVEEQKLLNSEEIWKDAKSVLQVNDFYALSLVGPQGSGKTTIAKQFATLARTDGYRIIYAIPEDFISAPEDWLRRVIEIDDSRTVEIEEYNNKVCIILDDLSYSLDATSRKNTAMIKSIVSRLRHIFKGQVFIIFITHRLHAAPPMLRNSGSWIFTNMQSADRDDALEVIGRSKDIRERLQSVYEFIGDVSIRGPRDGRIIYNLNGNEHVFKWGSRKDTGDGRLMAIYHAAQLTIFHSQGVHLDFNFDDYRYKGDNIGEKV